VLPNQYLSVNAMNHLVQGLLAPFGCVPDMTPPKRHDLPERMKKTAGFERDAEKLASDWRKVGNYINNAIDAHERESSRGEE